MNHRQYRTKAGVQLRKIEAVTGQFEQQNDSSKMDLLGDDWVSAGNGKVISEKQFKKNANGNFAAHGNGPNPYTIEKRDMQVYLFGDTAVVTYIKEYRQTPDTTTVFDEDITDVFTRSPKGWLWQFSKSYPVATNQRQTRVASLNCTLGRSRFLSGSSGDSW